MVRTRRVPLVLVASALLLVGSVLAGCSSDGSDGAKEPVPEELGAAEPAKAPVPSVEPAGSVRDLDPQPEGMVYDAETDILAVAVRNPTEVVLIQGKTGEEVGRAKIPGHARHLQLAGPGGPVLVPAEDSNMFVAVSLPDGKMTPTPVGNYPHDAAQARSGRILVADERGGTLSVIDDGKVVHTFDQPKQPGGVTPVGASDIGVVDVGAFTVALYDVDQEEQVAVLPAGEGPTHLVATGDDRLVVADTRGNAILVFATDPLEQVARLPLDGTPYGITYDPERNVVWVSLTARNELVGLDMSAKTPREIDRIPTVQQPNTIAVDPVSGRLWTASRKTGQLETIDP